MTASTFTPSRRALLMAGALSALAPWSRLALAGSGQPGGNRLVFVILRGGLDGLYAVPAVGDPAFASSRGPLAEYGAPPLRLAGGPFALHPALVQMHAMYGKGDLAVVHAVGQAYRERSHFDGQQVLESGGIKPYQFRDGWMGRALRASGQKGLAINTAVPLALRGGKDVDTWAPSRMADPDPDLLQRLERMYAPDPVLANTLQRARGLRGSEMAGMGGAGEAAGKDKGAVVAMAAKAAEFLAQPNGPQMAMLEMGGWDSHVGQDAPKGKLVDNLQLLDKAMAALRDGLSAPAAQGTWGRTVVVVATEFGRTVEMNGSSGTDHGNGGAAFVLGGAVKGGRVVTDWPGLAKANRLEGRDLMPTTDTRAVFKGVLADHLKISTAALDRDVFPESAGVKGLSLLKA
jgi:uncharacterized protein (DUF1501 family)